MLTEKARVLDELAQQARYGRGPHDGFAIVGFGVYELFDESGNLKQMGSFANLVTQVGDQYYGDRAAGIVGSTVNISSSTNATPIVVTTSSAHGFTVGDKVIVASHTTNTNANGTWNISAVGSATTLTLQGTTGNGVGGASGTVQSFSVAQVTGMRLGTGSTAPAKTGAGAAIVTYTTGSQKALDATYPQSSLSSGSRRITFQATWGAGVATANGLNEVVITNESPITDAAGVAGNTIARALLSPVVNKGANDTLVVTWNHDLLGA